MHFISFIFMQNLGSKRRRTLGNKGYGVYSAAGRGGSEHVKRAHWPNVLKRRIGEDPGHGFSESG
jgi:hypothetical protein